MSKISKIRLNKFMANAGVCSRRKADDYIREGRVKVNNNIADSLGQVIDDISDEIKFNDEIIKKNEDKIYIMLNKPIGYVTTSKEQFGRPCVLDLIKEKARVYPIGRLDMYTEGMLLFTNDGEYANSIMHPKKEVRKTYCVESTKELELINIKKLESGVDIGEYITKPAKIKLLNNTTFNITISEGKNRQIRKMCENIGITIKKLKRISIGKLELGALKLGKYRTLNSKEVESVFE